MEKTKYSIFFSELIVKGSCYKEHKMYSVKSVFLFF